MSQYVHTEALRPRFSKEEVEEMDRKAELENNALRQAAAELFKNVQVGRMVKSKGIFMGLMEVPASRVSRINICSIYAAPEDLMDKSGKKTNLGFEKTAQEIAGLRNWHGHDGSFFKDSEEVYAALSFGRHPSYGQSYYIQDGTYIDYNGQWFMPPIEILNGMHFAKWGVVIGNTRSADFKGNKIRADNLFDLKDTGDLRGTFTISRSGDKESTYWEDRYLSNTPSPDLFQSHRVYVQFSSGRFSYGNLTGRCRPCRAEALNL